jgi:ubiquitin-like-conjugating enzyme ATG10
LLPSRPSYQEYERGELEAFDEEEDVAAAGISLDVMTCRQYVVYSATFCSPAFYFSIHDSSTLFSWINRQLVLTRSLLYFLGGAPLNLEGVTDSPLFLRSTLPETTKTSFALETPDTPFAMLSQGDHPTLGTPCWYLHPCHTAEVVEELLREVGCEEVDPLLRWLEAWFMVLGNVVDFRLE